MKVSLILHVQRVSLSTKLDRALRDYLKVNLTDEDPHELARKFNIPVGLRNLGATCYANAFLQVWFQDLAFRSAVYKCQPSEASDSGKFEDSPIFQLQVTFSALQESNQYVYNPVKLVESLQLKTSIQQDAQESVTIHVRHSITDVCLQVLQTLHVPLG